MHLYNETLYFYIIMYYALTHLILEECQMPNIIVDMNQKGGVGKTTTAINIASWLCELGFKTALIDLDAQSNASISLGAREWGKSGESLSNHIMESSIRNSCEPFYFNTPKSSLCLLPSNIQLAAIALNISSKIHKEKILHNFIKNTPLMSNMDYIIIDCPPSLDVLTVNAIFAATHFLIPIDYGKYALEGMAGLLNTIAVVKEVDAIHDFWIVQNELDIREKIVNEWVENELKSSGLIHKVLNTKIRNSSSINKSSITGIPAVFNNDRGSEDLRSLTEEIVRRCSNV